VDVDLVQHEGETLQESLTRHLMLWMLLHNGASNRAVLNKAQVWVFEVMKDIRKRFPFEIILAP